MPLALRHQGEAGDVGAEGAQGERGLLGTKGKEGPPGAPGLVGVRVSHCEHLHVAWQQKTQQHSAVSVCQPPAVPSLGSRG